VPGIKTIALTTNGYRLDKIVRPLFEAGLSAINISLDSLDPSRFEQITGSRNLERVYKGVSEALRIGIGRVKINVVLLKSFIDQDLSAFLEFARNNQVSVRFIELMQTRENGEFFAKEHISGDEFRLRLEAQGWTELERSDVDGPAREFNHLGFAGRLGIIAPYAKDFCTSCNRLRISSRGKIKLCLFGDGELPLRHLLQSPGQRDELIAAVCTLIGAKTPSHRLHEGIFGSTQNLSGIGG
jgi:cyclic pyranopterin phosphate synthase